MMTIWPDHFPEACPPEDAKYLSVKVYMLVHSPIRPEDFLSLRERHPNSMFPDAELECQACGVSVFEKIEHIQRVQRRVKRLRRHAIGVCTLIPAMGVMNTGPISSKTAVMV